MIYKFIINGDPYHSITFTDEKRAIFYFNYLVFNHIPFKIVSIKKRPYFYS